MTFRRRIVLAMLPLLALLGVLGGTGAILIWRLGHGIDQILRENYDSVVAMRDLNEALERIDSSFQFALAGRKQESRTQYEENWKRYDDALWIEQNNITLPGEGELVDRLTELTRRYREQGGAFFDSAAPSVSLLYFGDEKEPGLYGAFREIKSVSGEILRRNQENMEEADHRARSMARTSLIWYGGGLAAAAALAILFVASTIRTILNPVRAVTESAEAIGAGNLNQVVPVSSDDELGQLAATFNAMARQLRDYRRSHQAQLLRAQQTSQATIDSFPDPILVLDQQKRVELANPVACRLFGVLPRGGAAEETMTWQPPEPLRQPLEDVLQSQRAYMPEGFDKAIALSEGDSRLSFLPRIMPIRDPEGATLGAAVLLENITRFRLLDELKSNLVATVSHELKTPLTSLRLVLHLLLEETLGPLSPKQTELLVDARENAERLLAMINNLLDLARLEQGGSQLRLQPETPADLVRAAISSFQPRAADRGVELSVDLPTQLPQVAVDADRFERALQNLLDNALRHTPSGGRITISAEPRGDRVVLSVVDTGTGIPPAHLPFVFEKYFRVPGDSHAAGSGLGLSIVREVITAHGGAVECESSPGEKTVFRVSLPVWGKARIPETTPQRRDS